MMGIFNWISSLGAWALSGRTYARKLLSLSFPFSCKSRAVIHSFSGTVKQLYFVGNYSLVIILVSGLFVGFVLGLQGDYVLSSYGASRRSAFW